MLYRAQFNDSYGYEHWEPINPMIGWNVQQWQLVLNERRSNLFKDKRVFDFPS